MSEHKFHFKSPDQIKKEYNNNAINNKKRNKILIIILADLLVLSIISILLYVNGVFNYNDFKLQEKVTINKLEYTGSVIHESNNRFVLFVNILNQDNKHTLFPKEDLRHFRIEAIDKNNHIFSSKISLSSRTLTSGETTIYRSEIHPGEKASIQSIHIHITSKKHLIFSRNSASE